MTWAFCLMAHALDQEQTKQLHEFLFYMEKAIVNDMKSLRVTELCHVLCEPLRVNADVSTLLKAAEGAIMDALFETTIDEVCRAALIASYETQLPSSDIVRKLKAYHVPATVGTSSQGQGPKMPEWQHNGNKDSFTMGMGRVQNYGGNRFDLHGFGHSKNSKDVDMHMRLSHEHVDDSVLNKYYDGATFV